MTKPKKWKYKTEGIGKNKKIREQRKLPIPLQLMRKQGDKNA